jgi:hypothetical protein
VVNEPLQSYRENAHGSNRRIVMTTCQAHGTAGFTNLLVTKEDGVIVVEPACGELLRAATRRTGRDHTARHPRRVAG